MRPSLHHVRRPRPEVLHPHRLHTRDRGCRSSCRSRRPCPRARRGRWTGSPGTTRSSAAASTIGGGDGSMARSRAGNGIEEITWSARSVVSAPDASVDVTETARPPSCAMRVTFALKTTLEPCASTSSWQRSHIIPGPNLGYWNCSMRLVTCFDLAPAPAGQLRADRLPHRAPERHALDPLRAPVRGHLGRRHPPHLLAVGLEEVLVEPPAVVAGDVALERGHGPSAGGCGPRGTTGRSARPRSGPGCCSAFTTLIG